MPITPDDLIKVLVEIIREKSFAYEHTQMRNAALSGGTAGAFIGIFAGAGFGALVGGGVGLVGGGACGMIHLRFVDEKVKDASDFLTAMKRDKKLQLLQHFQSSILILELDACSVETLSEQLKGDKSRTMQILKTYFDKNLGMDVDKFSAF